MKPLIVLEDLSRVYQVGEGVEVQALKGVSYQIVAGDFVGIMGPSGSGKTTLMNILGCLDRPTSGKYFLDDKEVSRLSNRELAVIRNLKIGFVFQSFNLLSRTTALENVEAPMIYADVPTDIMRKRAFASLEMVGLKGREHHKTNQISGGEMQRVAIARSLVNNPSLIMADEPTGNLDSKTSVDIMNLFTRLNKDKGLTIILVTHEHDIAAYANRRLFIRDGMIEREEISVDITKQGGNS